MCGPRYLTVQDMIWLNLQVTRTPLSFDALALEAATHAQYSYGSNNDILKQAGQLLFAFDRKHPFQRGNEATGFVATVTFLAVNGMFLEIEDEGGVSWYRKAIASASSAEESIRNATHEFESKHEGEIVQVARGVMNRYAETTRALVESSNALTA
ncbi:MAG: Fic family protein [Fimbriimonadaceae bacterium]|nr:Fic family protein [Fimbriimonadaceae bacterium]